MKKYLLILFLMVLLAADNPVSAAEKENSHSGHTSQSVEKQTSNPVNQAEHQQHEAGSGSSQPAQGHTPDKAADSHNGQANSHDGQKEVSNTGAHDGGGDHGGKEVKEVKDVNIKPWVSAFMIYVIAVIAVALMMKKGKDNKNELAS